MVYAMRSKILVVLLICCCINLTVANRWAIHLHGRDGPTTPSNTNVESTTTQTNKPSQTASGENASTQRSGSATATIAATNSTLSSVSSSATATSATVSPVTSNINGAIPTSPINLNYSGFNSTKTPDKLPITPQITPGFAVAGVILMLTGIVYTLVGIKNKWLHIYLSAGYLASIAVTVLILYVMNPPITNAVQGAYVVAAVMTGLVLGGAAIIFTEMTEGLGCLLGGFCFSMWLLVLKPGGLLTATSSKAIFIAAFTIAVFSTSFSHYTRPYGLITSISFSGATAVVMGIDCFSRAGLKEFWAYLWALNSNLFPLGATTYPLTRGIRVEIAAIIVIFLAGIVSQMKLWKVIKERRDKRATERLQDERTMEQEEENVGRRIEHANAEERNQWEAVYGDKDAVKSTGASIRDSGVGDMDSQKKGANSTVTSRRSGEEEIEMSDMSSPTLTTGAGLVMTGKDGGPVIVRVARDVEPPPELDANGNIIPREKNRDSMISPRSSVHQKRDDENIWVVGADGEARLERRPSTRHTKRASNSKVSVAPDVVPLPFKVPEGEEADDRSSVATFADEDQERRPSRPFSPASMIMRRLSKRSQRNSTPRHSRHFSMGEAGNSTEDLVIPRGVEDDRASSIAATMDGLSDDEDMRSIRSSIRQAPDTAEAARIEKDTDATKTPDINAETSGTTDKLSVPTDETKTRPVSEATIATAILEPEPEVKEPKKSKGKAKEIVEEDIIKSLTSSTDPKEVEADAEKEPEAASRRAPSIASVARSRPASISKDRLPAQMSKVVMSYRTNEWAKHLSNADAPEFEELQIAEYPAQEAVPEAPAPVNVVDLQQTAENAMPPPMPRSVSQMSNPSPALTRSGSAQSKTFPSKGESNTNPQDPGLIRSLSQQSLTQNSQQSVTPVPRGFRSVSNPAIPQPIVESPIEEDFPGHSPNIPSTSKFSPNPNVPFGSTNTLIGKRDSILRNKSSYSVALPSTPEVPYQFPTTYNSQFQYPQYTSGPTSRAGSDAGSIYNYPNVNAINYDEDNMSLSARRDLIRQNSLQQISTPIPPPLQQTPIPFDSHQPRRQSSGPSPMVREQQLASWRASVAHDLQSAVIPKHTIERQRSALWSERQQEDHRKAMEERKRGERDSAFDERMRRGDMLDAHREALRRMQATANKHA